MTLINDNALRRAPREAPEALKKGGFLFPFFFFLSFLDSLAGAQHPLLHSQASLRQVHMTKVRKAVSRERTGQEVGGELITRGAWATNLK